jgi:hypothetical protein
LARLRERDAYKRAVAAERKAGVEQNSRHASGREGFSIVIPEVRRPDPESRDAGSMLSHRPERGVSRRRFTAFWYTSDPAFPAVTGPDFPLLVVTIAAAEEEPREEDTPWTIRAVRSGHLMLITPERVLYAGLLGRPRERCQGAFNVYVALKGGLWITTSDGGERYGELLVVRRTSATPSPSDHRSAIAVLIEPESVRPARWMSSPAA